MQYLECDKPTNPKVDNDGYKLNTLKGIGHVYEQINIIWLLVCSWVLSNFLGGGGNAQEEGTEGGDTEYVVDKERTESEEKEDTNNEDGGGEETGDMDKGTEDGSVNISVSETATTEPQTAGNAGILQQKKTQCPTWSTFNSIITEKAPVWNIGICAPLYRRSPTEWPVLLSILTQAQKINFMTVGDGCRPIITLDGDLYDRAVKLKDYKQHWCIWLGGLHTTMAALKCLGKYVEGSGIDLAWEESGLYGQAKVRQTLEGRHVYRGIEAHTVTLIALHHLFLREVFTEEDRDEIVPYIEQVVHSFISYVNEPMESKDAKTLQEQIHHMNHQLSTSNVYERMKKWQENGKGIQKFMANYMNQVMVLLMFIGATRKADWKLHLAKMEELLPYFHAHDQYNYGRWGPLYVADMLELQTTDPDLWKFLDEGNFAITKHDVPFTAIDPDHAIEQEHKKMKSKGGFIGITGNESALEKHFIIAPTLARVVEEFKDYAGVESREASSLHHELTGDKGTKLVQNAAKLVQVISKQGNPFEESDMFNLVTFTVTPSEVRQNIENRDQLGRESIEKFVLSRMDEKTAGFWDPQKNNNIAYFRDVGPVVKAKVKGQLMSIKQERNLLSRLLVVAKSRPEFQVKDAIGEYEFDSTPPSNFQSDGSMIMLSGKSQVVQFVMNLPLPEDVNQPSEEDANGDTATPILIVDAMCIVNMVTKTDERFTAAHFAATFVEIIDSMSKPYKEIRVVFDQYLAGSLKETTRDKRTKKNTCIHYHVNDSTEIKNVKSFLAHIDTKAELTQYLADKLLDHYKGSPKMVLVMHHTLMKSNGNLSDIVSMSEMTAGHHNLEEGNQLVLLNAIDVMHKDKNAKLDVFSVDTDVLVLLTGTYPLLPPMTCLLRKKGERIPIWESYHKLGRERADALVGWYAFKGTDNTGTFAGKGVTSHFKAFMSSDGPILDAFTAFGRSTEVPEWVFKQMECYVCILYKPSGSVESVSELRWSLFAQNGKEGRQLPPTLGTLKPHTERAFFMALVWKSSCKPCPNILPPTNYSWQLQHGNLIPVLSENPPAPKALLELRRCSCSSSCMTNRCGCRKNTLVCTDACGCGDGCENSEDYIAEIEEEEELL